MITGIMAYANSENWKRADKREQGMMIAEYLVDIKTRGLPIIVKGEIIWSKEVEVEEGKLCPFCSWNNLKSIRGFVKIIDPYHPEGFLDTGGVWARCPHQTRRYFGGGRIPLVKIGSKRRRRFFRERDEKINT